MFIGQFRPAELYSAVSSAPWDALSQVVTVRPGALNLLAASTSAEVIICPARLLNRLLLLWSWITVAQSSSSGPMKTNRHEGNHIQTENNLLHTFQKLPPVACCLSFTLAQPVFQALWLTALPLAQPCVWETFALHTLLSLCALNTVFMQACCAHSHLASWSFFFFLEYLLWQTDL